MYIIQLQQGEGRTKKSCFSPFQLLLHEGNVLKLHELNQIELNLSEKVSYIYRYRLEQEVATKPNENIDIRWRIENVFRITTLKRNTIQAEQTQSTTINIK